MRIRTSVMATLAAVVLSMSMPSCGFAQSCNALRWACQNKGAIGLQGAGTCERYREQCGYRANRCQKLRYACEHKDEMGLQGAGTCERYRESCG